MFLIRYVRYLLILYIFCISFLYIYSYFVSADIVNESNGDLGVSSIDVDVRSVGHRMVLRIPAIGLYEEVEIGTKVGDKRGLWHIPYTHLPGGGGNVVIVGHRIDYSSFTVPPFFYLDRLEVGDSIEVVYNSNLHKYTVSSIEVVGKEDVFYETNYEEVEILTLYTCTPVLNPIKRLVVTARVVSIN